MTHKNANHGPICIINYILSRASPSHTQINGYIQLQELMQSGARLGPFLISYSGFSLLVPDQHNNTVWIQLTIIHNINLQLKMLQVSLDTKQTHPIHTDYRSKVGAGWTGVRSMVQYHDEFDRFYWSSGSGLNIEFYSNDTGYSFSQIEQEIRYEETI